MSEQPREIALRQIVMRVLTTHSIVEAEQGRSFPLSLGEATYATTCLLTDAEFRSAVGL